MESSQTAIRVAMSGTVLARAHVHARTNYVISVTRTDCFAERERDSAFFFFWKRDVSALTQLPRWRC